jgi:hypothetical protein
MAGGGMIDTTMPTTTMATTMTSALHNHHQYRYHHPDTQQMERTDIRVLNSNANNGSSLQYKNKLDHYLKLQRLPEQQHHIESNLSVVAGLYHSRQPTQRVAHTVTPTLASTPLPIHTVPEVASSQQTPAVASGLSETSEAELETIISAMSLLVKKMSEMWDSTKYKSHPVEDVAFVTSTEIQSILTAVNILVSTVEVKDVGRGSGSRGENANIKTDTGSCIPNGTGAGTVNFQQLKIIVEAMKILGSKASTDQRAYNNLIQGSPLTGAYFDKSELQCLREAINIMVRDLKTDATASTSITSATTSIAHVSADSDMKENLVESTPKDLKQRTQESFSNLVGDHLRTLSSLYADINGSKKLIKQQISSFQEKLDSMNLSVLSPDYTKSMLTMVADYCGNSKKRVGKAAISHGNDKEIGKEHSSNAIIMSIPATTTTPPPPPASDVVVEEAESKPDAPLNDEQMDIDSDLEKVVEEASVVVLEGIKNARISCPDSAESSDSDCVQAPALDAIYIEYNFNLPFEEFLQDWLFGAKQFDGIPLINLHDNDHTSVTKKTIRQKQNANYKKYKLAATVIMGAFQKELRKSGTACISYILQVLEFCAKDASVASIFRSPSMLSTYMFQGTGKGISHTYNRKQRRQFITTKLLKVKDAFNSD